MIRLWTLGALDLRSADGLELRGVLAQPKRAALLVYLALAAPRGPRRRDTLLALFWPELDAERARNALSQAVHFLRRSIGADLLINNTTDELSVDWRGLWCDAVAFEEALDADRLAEALELYRGPLLDGFHIANAPEFERWLDAERSRLGARYARAAEAAAAERERAGDLAGAVAYWHRLAARDPYSSRTALGLMRAMAAAGDAAGAVRHARVHETLLREELALAPDAEVTALVRELQTPTGARRMSSGAAPMPSVGTTVAPRAGETTSSRAADLERTRPADDAPARGPAAAPRAWDWRHHPSRRPLMMAAGLAAFGVAALIAVGARNVLTDSTPPIRSLAVLPFDNLSGNSADRVLVDGMLDALIGELARYPEVKVISRTSAIQYRETNKRLPEIARELNVDAVLEGAMLHEGGRVRVNARLVHGKSDRPLWADTYRRDLRDILTLQGELAGAIARQVRFAAAPSRRVTGTPGGPPDSIPAEVYLRELYIRARHAQVTRSLVGMQSAMGHYRRAIERDSSFALAYAGLAENHALQAHYDFMPKAAALDSARMLAQRAVALDSMLAEARIALALSLGYDGKLAEAERELLRAIDLSPSNAAARHWYGMLLVALGRGQEALEQAEIALRLDPLGPRVALSTKRFAIFLITGKRPYMTEPVGERRKALTAEPGEAWARARDAAELAEAQQCPEARRELRRAQQLVSDSGNMVLREFEGRVYWSCGERSRARALVAQMKREPDATDHGLRIALLHARFGEPAAAFEWLGRHRWTITELAILRGDDALDPLRSDPRFADLLVRIGVGARPSH